MASAEGTELTPVSIKTQGLLAAGNTDKSSQDDLLLLSTWHKVVYREGDGTHSSTLAWKIPWMEEPGGVQSMGSRRFGHD